MKNVEFTKDWRYRREPHAFVQYLANKPYSISDEAYAAAEKAGVLKEQPNARSGGAGRKGSADASEG